VTRIRTGSRLHFGLLGLPGQGAAPTSRSFGGVGLMIDEPGVEVDVETASDWNATGPSAMRALDFAKRLTDQPLSIRVERCPAEHVGLGAGTQLAMAVGMAVRRHLGTPVEPIALAADLGRGLRSGLGVHGFVHGGFLVDGGKGPHTTVAPLTCRHEFPGEWSILLVTPRESRGLAGANERAAFDHLARQPVQEEQTETLCRLVLLGLVPALLERELAAFGEAAFEFNRRAGLLFKASQGGEYASPAAAHTVARLRDFGLRAVGQSSWGPTLFAIGEPDRLGDAKRRLLDETAEASLDARIASARNRGWEEPCTH
jgi:beta-RFAP synthase